MADDHLVDIVDMLKRRWVLRDFTKNPNAPQCCDQIVASVTRQNELATYLKAVASGFVSITSTLCDSPFSRCCTDWQCIGRIELRAKADVLQNSKLFDGAIYYDQ
jgi:hypothetical protein